MYGKDVSDLQSGISFNANGTVTGTLKYVTGYTGFSGEESEQSGNYLAFKVDSFPAATTYRVSLIDTTERTATLDSDKNIVARISDATTQKIRVTATLNSVTLEKLYDLSTLTIETE